LFLFPFSPLLFYSSKIASSHQLERWFRFLLTPFAALSHPLRLPWSRIGRIARGIRMQVCRVIFPRHVRMQTDNTGRALCVQVMTTQLFCVAAGKVRRHTFPRRDACALLLRAAPVAYRRRVLVVAQSALLGKEWAGKQLLPAAEFSGGGNVGEWMLGCGRCFCMLPLCAGRPVSLDRPARAL